MSNGKCAVFLLVCTQPDHQHPESDAQSRAAHLASKYKDRPISVIVAIGDATLRFATKLLAEHWPEVPVVFTMVDADVARNLQLPRNVTGITSKQKLSDNVDVARALVPDLARVAIVSDPYETLVAFRNAREELAGIAATKLEIVDLTGMRMRDLKERVANLPAHTAILYLSINSDGEGNVLLPYEGLKQISDVANRPIFVSVKSQIGFGGIGGLVLDPARVGEVAAPLVRRILNGESASTVEVAQGDVVRPIFDWRQLQRWGVKEQSLPPESEIQFQEPALWNTYRTQILSVVAALLFSSRVNLLADL